MWNYIFLVSIFHQVVCPPPDNRLKISTFVRSITTQIKDVQRSLATMDVLQPDAVASAVRRLSDIRTNTVRVGHDHNDMNNLLPLVDNVVIAVNADEEGRH
jgi:hypothetical protein